MANRKAGAGALGFWQDGEPEAFAFPLGDVEECRVRLSDSLCTERPHWREGAAKTVPPEIWQAVSRSAGVLPSLTIRSAALELTVRVSEPRSFRFPLFSNQSHNLNEFMKDFAYRQAFKVARTLSPGNAWEWGPDSATLDDLMQKSSSGLPGPIEVQLREIERVRAQIFCLCVNLYGASNGKSVEALNAFAEQVRANGDGARAQVLTRYAKDIEGERGKSREDKEAL